MGAPLSEISISLRAFSHLGGFCLAASAFGRTFTLSGQLFFLKLSSSGLSSLCFLLRGFPFRTFVLPFLPLFRGFLLLNFRSSVFCLRGSSLSGFSSLRVSLLSQHPFRTFVLPGPPLGLSPWWVAVDSNHRPLAYQASALTN